MKSSLGIFVVCFLSLTSAYIIPKVKNFPAVFLPDGKCPPVEGEYPVLLPDTEDPTIFYICSHGVPVQKKCPLGLIFDPFLQVCVRQKHNFQHPKTSTPVGECPSLDGPEPVYLEDSENATIFYECSNGFPWKHVCPSDLVFNITLKVCVKKELHSLKKSVISFLPKGECPPENGEYPVFLPDDEDLTIYYECNRGFPIKMKCPSGLIFNPKLNVCVRKE